MPDLRRSADDRIEHFQCGYQLATGKNLDLQPATARRLDALRQPFDAAAEAGQPRWPGGNHVPFKAFSRSSALGRLIFSARAGSNPCRHGHAAYKMPAFDRHAWFPCRLRFDAKTQCSGDRLRCKAQSG